MHGEKAKWAEAIARAGLVAKGIVYTVIGVLTALAAFGMGGKIAGKNDAFIWIIDLPFGRILLGIVAVGLLGYVLWRGIQAIDDPENYGSDAKGIARRIGFAANAIVYGALAYYSGMLALQGSGSGGNGDGGGSTRQFIVSKILQQPAGQWIVGAVALFFIGLGIFQIYRSLSGKYRKKVSMVQMNTNERNTYMTIGRIGFIARGIVLLVIGFLFIKAAFNSNAEQAEGTQGAFQFLNNSGYGPWLLGSVALGLAAYGMFCFVQARYRRIKT